MSIFQDAGLSIVYYRGTPGQRQYPTYPGAGAGAGVGAAVVGSPSPEERIFLQYNPGFERKSGQFLTGFTLTKDLNPYSTVHHPETSEAHSSPSSEASGHSQLLKDSPEQPMFHMASFPDFSQLTSTSAGSGSGSGILFESTLLTDPPPQHLAILLELQAATRKHRELNIPEKIQLLLWISKHFQKTNDDLINSEHLPFKGFILRIEPRGEKGIAIPAQQLWYEDGILQNEDLLDNTPWSIAAQVCSLIGGEGGRKYFEGPEIESLLPPWKKFFLEKFPHYAGFLLALLAAGKPLPGISSFFAIIFPAGPGWIAAAWILASIGTCASVAFYWDNITKCFKKAAEALLKTPRIEFIQRQFVSMHAILPPPKKTFLLTLFTILFGAGYSGGNVGMVMASGFLESTPWLRWIVLTGVFITNFCVGTEKSAKLTTDWAAVLEQLIGTRNPGIATQDALLTAGLAQLSRCLTAYSEAQVQQEKLKLPGHTGALTPETYQNIEVETYKLIRVLQAMGIRNKNYSLQELLSHIYLAIRSAEDAITRIKIALIAPALAATRTTETTGATPPNFEVTPPHQISAPDVEQGSLRTPARTPAETLTPSPPSITIRTPLLTPAQTPAPIFKDARHKAFSFSAIMAGDNGPYRPLMAFTAKLSSIAISVTGGFSNIAGLYHLFQDWIPSPFWRLVISIFCTLSIFGLNKERTDQDADWVLAKLGQASLDIDSQLPGKTPESKNLCACNTKFSLLLGYLISLIQGTAGMYFCLHSTLFNFPARVFCGIVTLYTMTVTKGEPTQKKLESFWKNWVQYYLTKFNCLHPEASKPKIIETHSFSVAFQEEQIKILLNSLAHLVNHYNNQLNTTQPGPGKLWLLNFLKDQIGIALKIDPALEKKLELKPVPIRKTDKERTDLSYLSEFWHRLEETQRKTEASGNYQEEIRSELINFLYREHDYFSVLLSSMNEKPSVFNKGPRQECPITSQGFPTPVAETHPSASRDSTASAHAGAFGPRQRLGHRDSDQLLAKRVGALFSPMLA